MGKTVKTKKIEIKRNCIEVSIVLIWLCLVSGCAPYFQTVEKPDDMGLVYFYRPKKLFHGGLNYLINANGFKINTLYNGGYFYYMAKPGRIQFSCMKEVSSCVTLDVEPGQTYYIKLNTLPGIVVSRPYLRLVPAEEGEQEISLCRKINKGQKAN